MIHPCRTPRRIQIRLDWPSFVLITAYWFQYRCLISFLSCIGMPAFSMILINFSWLIRSNAFWKSTKHAYIFLLTCSDRSVIVLSLNIASLVPLPFRNPIWLLERCRSMIGVILALIRCSKTFDAWEIKLIVRKSQQSCAWLTFGNVMKTVWRKSSGILPDLYMLSYILNTSIKSPLSLLVSSVVNPT